MLEMQKYYMSIILSTSGILKYTMLDLFEKENSARNSKETDFGSNKGLSGGDPGE
jgi:hypothetical protein